MLWIKRVQEEEFPEELDNLKAGESVGKGSRIYNLSPILIDGVICIDTRLRKSPELSATAKFPPILTKKHPYTILMIHHFHRQMGHRANQAVLAGLQQRSWMVHGLQAVKNAVAMCQHCKNRKAKASFPRMADLPESRFKMLDGAFAATGIDYFGPKRSLRGRSEVKLWGVILRCSATKAVHFELVDSLDTNGALMAITRMQARRGNVRQFHSDNGSNLRAAEKELRNC